MKRILILFVFTGTFVQAQQEARLDILDALVMKSLEVSYEAYLNNETSLGASLFYNFSKDNAKFRYNEDLMITPYFRYYLPISSSSLSSDFKFFGELFLGINKGNKKVNIEDEDVKKTVSYTDGALGIGGGLKYVSEQNFVFDAHAGIGRNLFSEKSPAIVPKIGVSIGYRF